MFETIGMTISDLYEEQSVVFLETKKYVLNTVTFE